MIDIHLMHWITYLGYTGVLIVLLVETGLFIGFFLPGDSLLLAVGVLGAKHVFNLSLLIPEMVIVVMVGYVFGYWFGDTLGVWLSRRSDSVWFKKCYLISAKKFYIAHGGAALVLGRLVPVVRTFVPIVAGMVGMSYWRYMFFNVIGALLWVVGITLTGYYFGKWLPGFSNYALLLIALVIVLSLGWMLWLVARSYWLRSL